jgi:hypothetical protein
MKRACLVYLQNKATEVFLGCKQKCAVTDRKAGKSTASVWKDMLVI